MTLALQTTARGFTLIEVMIVVGVISVLAAIAWPMYESQSMKHRRADAVIALTRISNELNKYFSDNETYVDYTVSASVTNALKNYTIDLTVLTANTFTVTATPTGAQAGDADCTTLTINHLGQKGYTGAAPSAARCWGSTN